MVVSCHDRTEIKTGSGILHGYRVQILKFSSAADLEGASWFGSLDAFRGFWQFPLES
jgi:hypothetical protein